MKIARFTMSYRSLGRVGAALVALLFARILFVTPIAIQAAGPSALSFNGASHVRVTDSASLRIPINLTIEAWVKPTAVAGHQHIVGKNNYELSVEPSGSGFKALFEFSSSGQWRSVNSGQLNLNQWHHIVGSYDGSNMRLYVNGSRVANLITSGAIDQTTNPLRIASADGSGDLFQGLIDEVRVSNIIRYTGNFVVPQAPFATDAATRGLWHLDERSGTTTADASGNGNNGTFVGSPTWATDSPFAGPDTTPPVVSNVNTSNIATTSATITWTTDEPATSQVEYGTTAAYGANTPFNSALVTNHSQTLSGLTFNTIYNYRVISRDAAGNQTFSPNFTFTTLAESPPTAPVISGMTTGNITSSSVTISWQTDVPADSQIEYGTTTTYGSSTPLDTTLVTNHNQTITGLAAGVTYHYRVKSRGQNDVQAISGDGVFTTSSGSAAATMGQWSSALNWPLVAVHSALLPTGDVVMWDAWELSPNVAAKLWNPTSQTFTGVTNRFSSIFCSGHVMLADGRHFVAGGFVRDGYGIKDANIFDPATSSWSKVADMAYDRWYPTVVTLADGRTIALGGQLAPGVYADIPEIYNATTDTWTQMNSARLNLGEYPNSYLLPNGKIFVVAAPSDERSRVLDVSTQTWSTLGVAPVATGSSVMYRPGKVLATGGGTNNADPVTNGVAVIDMNQSSLAWRQVSPMAFPRFQHNLVTLADGSVMAIGGSTKYSLVSTQGTKEAEIWNPNTETWTTVAAMRDLRMYHSTAMLLPDGRVLVAGGGRVAPATDYLTAEIYSPPYLFRGARPTITGAPANMTYGSTFNVQTPDTASIDSVALVRLPSVTHTINTDQRYVPLTFSVNGNSLAVQSPANGNIAPPGYYMLFITNSNGVPSSAKFIQIGGTSQSDTQAPTVSVTTPTNGVTVSGAVTLSANANDNVGVSSVQFLVDGAPAGAADTSAPFSITWDSATVANGTHTISAQARDAAGNTAVATPISVTVSNTTADTTPPIISAVTAVNIQSNAATITWTTNEPATTQVEYGLTEAYGSQTINDTALVTSHNQTLSGLTPSSVYHYRVRSTDAAGNLAISPDFTFTTAAPGSAPVTLIGDTAILSKGDNNPAGMAEAFQYVATTSGTADRIHVYVDGNNTANTVVVGLYANTRDDNPGILLTQTTMTNPTNGAWNEVPVPPTNITAGGKYWIAVLGPIGGGTFQFRDTETGGKAQISLQSNLSILPANWSPGSNYFNSPMSAYVTQSGQGVTPTITPVPPTATHTLTATNTPTAAITNTPTTAPTAPNTPTTAPLTATLTPAAPTATNTPAAATATSTPTSAPPTATSTPMPTGTSTPTPNTSGGFPVNGILDNFNRANGAPGNNWVGATSGYNVRNNTLDVGNAGALYWSNSFGSDQEVYVTLTEINTNAEEINLLLKGQGTGECGILEVLYKPSAGIVQIWTCHGPGWIQHGSDMSVTFQAGDRFGARAKTDGTVEVYKNGTLAGTVTVSNSWPYRANGGRIGVWVFNGPNVVLDDFGGGTR
jgi:hypothetical protein